MSCSPNSDDTSKSGYDSLSIAGGANQTNPGKGGIGTNSLGSDGEFGIGGSHIANNVAYNGCGGGGGYFGGGGSDGGGDNIDDGGGGDGDGVVLLT